MGQSVSARHVLNDFYCLILKSFNLFCIFSKKKKKWMGTVAGTLSHFSSYLFLSGTPVIHEPAWWTLTYPKLSPLAISNICKSKLNVNFYIVLQFSYNYRFFVNC